MTAHPTTERMEVIFKHFLTFARDVCKVIVFDLTNEKEFLPMKRLLSALSAILLCLMLFACAAPAAPEPTPTPLPTATPETTEAPTPEPTQEPTPAPTPEPTFIETALDHTLFSAGKITVSVTGIRFSENNAAYVDLLIENASIASVSFQLDSLCLNDWQVDGALQDAQNVAAGETRKASAAVSFIDDPNASYMGIGSIASVTLSLSMTSDASGDLLIKQKSFTVPVPDASPAADPAESATLVYEDNNLAVYLQGMDTTLQHTRALLYKKPSAKWMSVTVDPVYAGYTNIVNRTYTMEPGKYRLLSLDGTEVMTRENITALSKLDLYLSLNQFDGRLNRPVLATITDPNVAETVMAAPEAGPIVYQSELSYFILRNMGLTEFEGHEAILLDFENITQNYIKPLDLTAYASNPDITIDGTAYPLKTYCTNCYPTTHGFILLWPDGAPEGALSSAASVTVGLKIARINGGHLDPIVDTRDFSFNLK